MAGATQIHGFKEVEANLNRQLEGIRNRSMKGLIMGAALVRNETEKTPPLTPVDLGNLRASWFVVTSKGIQVGKGLGQFKGPKAATIASDHSSTIAEAQGFVVANSTKEKQFLMMGYSANYALFVHENLEMHDPSNPYWVRRKKQWKVGSGPKWFESAVKNNTSRIVQIVKDNAQIKG